MINLRKTLETAKARLEEAHIAYALIGGFALGAHGIHRATKDIDLLVDGSNKDKIKNIFIKEGFQIFFESDDILQFQGPGYLDVVLARRPLSLEMLHSAPLHKLFGVPVINPEGIVGLKIQAYKNDPTRKLKDLADIQELLKIQGLNMTKIKQYADLFGEWTDIEAIYKMGYIK